MGFKCGIVGLPKVGKSKLFKPLTATPPAEAANYSFCPSEAKIGRVAAAEKKARGNDKEAKVQLEIMLPALAALRDGKPARGLELAAEQAKILRSLQLMSAKPVLYVCNVDEASAATGNEYSAAVERFAKAQGAATV